MARQYTPTERIGVNAVERKILGLGWIFREQPTADFGIDAHVEICNNSVPSGRLIALQIKAGESFFKEAAPEGVVYRGSNAHLEYWIGHSLPVLLVLYHPESDEAWWCAITSMNIERTPKGWHVMVPRRQRLDESARSALADFAVPDFTRRQRIEALAWPVSSPDKQVCRLTSLLDALARASREIDVAAPFLDDTLLWALLPLAHRGVRVRLLTLRQATEALQAELAELESAKVEWRTLTSMHAKCVVIDGVLVIYGSANFYSRAWRDPVEQSLATLDETVVRTVRASFEEGWARATARHR